MFNDVSHFYLFLGFFVLFFKRESRVAQTVLMNNEVVDNIQYFLLITDVRNRNIK